MNNIEIIKLLLNRNDILLNNEYGGIPLQLAVGFGLKEIVNMLLSHPNHLMIDINFKDDIYI